MSDEEIQDFGEGGGTDAGWDEDEDGATMVAHVDSLGGGDTLQNGGGPVQEKTPRRADPPDDDETLARLLR